MRRLLLTIAGAVGCTLLLVFALTREPNTTRVVAAPRSPALPRPAGSLAPSSPSGLTSTQATPSADSATATPPADVVAALALPPGPARSKAFGVAIERWILNEPGTAATYIPRLADPGEFDRAAALLVIHTDTIHRPTALALGWAEDIATPDLRRLALIHVLREWADRDPDAACGYIEHSPALGASERDTLLSAITPFPPET